jgi:AraC-like DNA-binding protein
MAILDRYRVIDATSAAEVGGGGPLFGQVAEPIQPIGVGAFRVFINSVALGSIRLTAVGTTGHRISPIDTTNVTVLLPWHGVLVTDDGLRTRTIRAGQIAIPRPGRRSTMIPGRYLGLVVQVPLARLTASDAANPFDDWRPERDWPERDWPEVSGEGGALHRCLRYLVAELDASPVLDASGRVAGSAATLLTDLLLDLMQAKPAGPVAEAGVDHVRRAEEAIRARLAEDISISALAAEIGIGTRSLQFAFRRHRGMAPRDAITAFRLDAARDRLLAAQDETVTAVALECGLHHLGRFAAQYRQRFGEAPSETLARARRAR